jgi:L-ascorbate metabolism protein UlaG (beta-lactamase superfamily)
MRTASKRNLLCLGVGDGHPSPERGHAAFLYQFGSTRLLVDCGEPASRSLQRAGIGADDFEALLISHLHFDHVGGLFTLLQGLWLAPRRRPLTVYLPAHGIPLVRQLMKAACLFEAWNAFPLELAPLRAGRPFEIGPVRVTPLPSSHMFLLRAPPARRNDALSQAFSFLLEMEGCRVAHSADLGDLADAERLTVGDLDLLVCEPAHVDAEELLVLLRGRTIRRAAFVHLTRLQWQRRQEFLRHARQAMPGTRVCIPEDGDRLKF